MRRKIVQNPGQATRPSIQAASSMAPVSIGIQRKTAAPSRPAGNTATKDRHVATMFRAAHQQDRQAQLPVGPRGSKLRSARRSLLLLRRDHDFAVVA
jgi:hypothetical protein